MSRGYGSKGKPPLKKLYDLGEFGGTGGDEELAPLSWRDDPMTSLSDWRIIVKTGGGSKTYHVHKAMIAAGGRRSDYFTRQCRGSGAARMSEAAKGESKIDLESAAAEAMPLFLDFVYTGELDATKETACALVHLANYLSNAALHAAATDFLQRNLNYNTAPYHLAHAELFSLDKIAAVALELVAKNLECYEANSPEYYEENPEESPDVCVRDFWSLHPDTVARVVQAGMWFDTDSLCRVIAQYANQRFDDIEEDFIAAVVCMDHDNDNEEKTGLVTYVEPSASMVLLRLACKHANHPVATELRRRCVKAAAEDWENSLLPLYREEKKRKQEQEEAEKERASAKTNRKKSSKGSSSSNSVGVQPRHLPLGPGLPVEVQLELLGNMMAAVAGE